MLRSNNSQHFICNWKRTNVWSKLRQCFVVKHSCWNLGEHCDPFIASRQKNEWMSETKTWSQKRLLAIRVVDIGHRMGAILLGKLGPCRWERGPKKKKKKISIRFFSHKSPISNLPACTHICRNSWGALHKYIHTSHHHSTHGSLYQRDRRHRETFTELFGHSHLLFPPGGPLTCTQHRRLIKGVIPLWKMALVTKIHK